MAGACLLTLCMLLSLLSGAQADRERVICPAVDFQDYPPVINGAGAGPRPVLIALGTSKLIEKNRDGTSNCRLEIEEVLYGERRIKAVEFSSYYVAGLRGVFTLRPGDSGEPEYICSDVLTEVDHLEAVRALCRARLTLMVLDTETIVIGEEAAANGPQREIKVIEQLSGSKTPLLGPIVIRSDHGKRPPGLPGTQAARNIYLLERNTNVPLDAPVSYICRATFGLDAKQEVATALARRDSYPLVDQQGEKVREVTFDGTADEAMALFNTDYRVIHRLGQRFLVHHGDEARIRLTPLIEAQWLDSGPKERGKYDDQKVRIETLAQAEHLSPTGAIVSLAEKLIDRLEALPPEKATANAAPETDAGAGEKRWREEDDTDSNHSLTWLLKEIDEKEVARRWAARLTALRERLTGARRQEVALAISVTRIDSNSELHAALARMQAVQPVRSRAGLRHRGNAMLASVAFSPDGKLLATGDDIEEICVWDTHDWQCVTVIPRGANRLAFSPDSKSLYLAASGGRGDTALFSRYDVQTGRVDRDFSSPTQWTERLQLTRDGRTMLTASYMDGTLIVWDTATGEKRRSERLPRLSAAAAVSDDGRRLARQIDEPHGRENESEIVVETADGKETLAHIHYAAHVRRLAFTPDGVYVLSAGESRMGGEFLQIHKLGETVELVAEAKPAGAGELVVSPDGKLVTVGSWSSHLWLYSIPDLKLVRSATFPENRTVRSIAFSPEGKWLIAATGEPAPRLFRLDDFKAVPPPGGHHGYFLGVHFSSDNQRLWSVDQEGTICLWDAATMKMIERRPAPENTTLLSVREPDGKYAVFMEGQRPSFGEKVTGKIFVVDGESGKVVSRLELPPGRLGWIHWLPDGQFLVFGDGMVKSTTIVDFVNGKILQQYPHQPSFHRNFLSADHRSVIYDSDYKSPGKPTSRLDLVTGGETEPLIGGGGHTLTADDETYTLLGSAGVPERWPEVRGVAVESGWLSPKGSRLAVVTGEPVQNDAVVRTPNSEFPTVVRIHDAKTLRMICAISSATRRIQVRFNADGSQLAIAHDDGTIERWPLPE